MTMNRLAQTLASIIRDKVLDATKGRNGTKLESRFIFHGPSLDLLEMVYDELAKSGGIQIPSEGNSATVTLPILLQLPAGHSSVQNPKIGTSGKCEAGHLLDCRDNPEFPSFVALIPPLQHNNASITSTSDEFGVKAANRVGSATFSDWWNDTFIQGLVTTGLENADITGDELNDARHLVRAAAEALDEVEHDIGLRQSAWHLLSRIYSISNKQVGVPPADAISLACGFPPMGNGCIVSKRQLDVLEQISDGMADGFRTGIDRMRPNASTQEVGHALSDFLAHVQSKCEIPTAFERATAAFYLPANGLEIEPPPAWWRVLTTACWTELLAEEKDETTDDLSIKCINTILPAGKGMPAVVWDSAELSISLGTQEPTEVQLTGGSTGKTPSQVQVTGCASYLDLSPPTHKTPITYKAAAEGRKTATARVISLMHWAPGILVACKVAKKLFPPKKPSRKTGVKTDWETSLSLPGSGRYELLLLVPYDTVITEAIGTSDDATETEVDEGPKDLKVEEISSGKYQVEIEADGKYQLDITFQRSGQSKTETCRTYITCEETKEEGCRSEFERLIKLNRRALEKLDTKAVVQLDRHARLSSLQSWMLEEHNIAKSFRPLVIADDYASRWIPPDWDAPGGAILSRGRFLHDPRPEVGLFQSPPGFIEARRKIAEWIRRDDDEQSGLVESAPLGSWLAREAEFRELTEQYLDSYMAWLASDREIASWVDVIAVSSFESDGYTLARVPDAIILSPLHPLRFAWHCLAQQVLYEEAEGNTPCPAASILDPDCVPDLLTLPLQSPGGVVDQVDFLSVECNSDYWSVLWNGSRLDRLADRSRRAPFDNAFGLTVGGISSGFSPAQVARALDDVSDLLAAKPIVSLVVSSTGGTTDACNDGLTDWCARRFGNDGKSPTRGVGPRLLEVFDTRPPSSRPDEATIANLSEDTSNHVRWFDKQPHGSKPDLGIIAQLDSAQPESTEVGMRSPLGTGGLIRHRVRRQLHGAFLSESRQGLQMPPTGDVFADKVSACMLALEGCREGRVGLQFAPNVHAVADMLLMKKAGFVAVSSTAIDPACFLGGWIEGTYLWDYDLPSYSLRAGDTSGYYLLSQVKEADCEALRRVLTPLPGCEQLTDEQVEQVLLEVARRGIPTVRGLSGDDTGATGDLGLFITVRLLQDQFRPSGNLNSLLPVLAGSQDDASIAIIVPVDPFRGYLADLAKAMSKDASLSRPDLLVVGIHERAGRIRLHLTPVEVKCRQGSVLGSTDVADALAQASALSMLFRSIEERASKSTAWRLAYQHLLLSMIGFGLRVYSQHHLVAGQSALWAGYHERIAAAILNPTSSITIDDTGRLLVVDGSAHSGPYDRDGDGHAETIVISAQDAGRIVSGDAQAFYDAVRSKVGDWGLLPHPESVETATPVEECPPVTEQGKDTCPHGQGVDEEQKPEGASGLDQHQGLISLPTPPAPDTIAPKADDEAGSGIILSVGQTVDGFEPRQLSLNISDTRLNQLNIGVVGDLGTGKTQFLKSLIMQITKASQENRGIKPRFLIFDYKRDYSSPDFVAATGAKVVKPTRLPLNLFDTTGMGESVAPWLDRFRFFADVLNKVYSGIGPVQRDKLKGAVRNAYDSCGAQGRQPTIYDIHAEYRELLGDKTDSPMAIIDDLVDMEVFARSQEDTKPFDEFLDGVVVISLDAMGQDDRGKNMLVAVMLNMFYENMLRTPKRPFKGSEPQLRVIDSYLLVDEADNIMRYEFDVLRKLLLQGREFGTGVILASQYLRHFKAGATDYREPLLTWFIHKVPNVAPTELSALGFTSDLGELSEHVKTLPNHHCLYKSFDVAGEVIRGLPFYELVKGGDDKPA